MDHHLRRTTDELSVVQPLSRDLPRGDFQRTRRLVDRHRRRLVEHKRLRRPSDGFEETLPLTLIPLPLVDVLLFPLLQNHGSRGRVFSFVDDSLLLRPLLRFSLSALDGRSRHPKLSPGPRDGLVPGKKHEALRRPRPFSLLRRRRPQQVDVGGHVVLIDADVPIGTNPMANVLLPLVVLHPACLLVRRALLERRLDFASEALVATSLVQDV
mmetsp:Transcript_3426/g.11248  ORF Transcript_3426/g.11248 Transcript_3426/m.11248 type:complete len:212 (+) Transcript_3426:146-781(+)